MHGVAKEFIQFALKENVLRFGEFELKSGRVSPYFFNAGEFNSGKLLHKLSQFYARRIAQSGIKYDMLFGPAYKGIPLATATATALSEIYKMDTPFCFNRKEAKSHGEGGQFVGAPLAGDVLIIDDVITAGTAFAEAEAMITEAGAKVCGVIVALDRQERGSGENSAIDEIRSRGIPVHAIAKLEDIINYLNFNQENNLVDSIAKYQAEYGVR